jgi:glycosyltransferase involved in cell wall biosynthesis
VFPNTAAKLYEPIEPADAPDEGAMMPHDGFTIMFAGNIGESQDFDTIIEAAALLRARHQINWVILGSGRDLERVKRRVADTHIEDLFHFLGRHPEARMPLFFAHADAMLVSLRRNDIFALTVPYKVQSYMACGKPIIAALDGEGARIVREAGAGVSAPAQSPAVLAEQIHAMIETFETRRAAYARNSLGYFRKNYSANDLYNALFSYLDETVSEHGPKAVSAASRTGTMKDSNR